MQMKSVVLAASTLALGFAVFVGAPAPASAQSAPVVYHAVRHDVSIPLRDMHLVPERNSNQHKVIINRQLEPGIRPSVDNIDPVVQNFQGPEISARQNLNFAGLSASQSGGYAPPDTNGSIGSTQYVQTVNIDYAVYDKTTGALTFGPFPLHTIWTGFGGVCSSGDGGDPVVLFDKAAQRWLVGQLPSSYNAYCLAVSTTSDATGSYARYEFSLFSGQLPDYPKLGVWSDGYYFSANIFGNGAAEACAFDRTSMLSGGNANAICFPQTLPVFSLLPSDLDGNTAPPAGEPNFFIELGSLGTTLNLFKFHADFVNPKNATFTGPTVIPVAPFKLACGGGSCVPQKGTSNQLDSLGDRIMYRLAYRNISGTEYLAASHSVAAGNGSQTAVRWYEIQNPNGTPVVLNSGSFAPDKATFRWMPSIAMDKVGDVLVGYSTSSSSTYAGIRVSARIPTDPANTLEREANVLTGTGAETTGLSRWGDYSSMSVDPADDCTVWYTTEYEKTSGIFNWYTHVVSFKLNNCK